MVEFPVITNKEALSEGTELVMENTTPPKQNERKVKDAHWKDPPKTSKGCSKGSTS